MANTTAVYARIDNDIKREAEGILAQLGITPSSAIQMLYSQIILNRGLPFTPRIPECHPLSLADMTPGQLEEEISKGLASIERGDVLSADEVDKIFTEEFGIPTAP